MKPDFNAMSRAELLAYVKEHRTDDEVIRELFVNRRSPDETAIWYSFPWTEEGKKQMEEVFRQKIEEIEKPNGNQPQL